MSCGPCLTVTPIRSGNGGRVSGSQGSGLTVCRCVWRRGITAETEPLVPGCHCLAGISQRPVHGVRVGAATESASWRAGVGSHVCFREQTPLPSPALLVKTHYCITQRSTFPVSTVLSRHTLWASLRVTNAAQIPAPGSSHRESLTPFQ